MATSCGADILANALQAALIAGKSFAVPDVNLNDPLYAQPGNTGDLFADIDKLKTEDLTTGVVGGDGVFDKIMMSLTAHLKIEFKENRISGAEYSKAYQAVVASALGVSVQFLLGRDQAYWQAVTAQKQAQLIEVEKVKARVDLETAKVMLVRAKYEATTTEANYALTKMKIATEDATYCNLAAQKEILLVQKAGVDLDNAGKTYTNANILPEQLRLLSEQVQVQRAQTTNTRYDGITVTGLIGKQKDLYTQQITSYQRDAETKAAKIFADVWVTGKTMDEGLEVPTALNNNATNTVFTRLKSRLDLD